MIVYQTQPRLNQFSWRSTPNGVYVFECNGVDWTAALVQLAFDSVEEAEAFATMAAQMAQDYRLSKGGETPAPVWPCSRCGSPVQFRCEEFCKACLASFYAQPAPAMSEVDRLLVEAVVASRPDPAEAFGDPDLRHPFDPSDSLPHRCDHCGLTEAAMRHQVLTPPGDDSAQCCECDQEAVGYSEGSPYCAAHYRSRPSLAKQIVAEAGPLGATGTHYSPTLAKAQAEAAERLKAMEPVDHAARNLAICNEARAMIGKPPLTQAEYDDLPF